MIARRGAAERGYTHNAWLSSHHTFSFGDYDDPKHRGVSNLRVINEDVIAPAGGFPTHGHRDMEIVTYVLSGALEHKDSMGNGAVIRPGEVQRMSAGSGVLHSEFNASELEPVRLLQIWLRPNRNGVAPGYAQRLFSRQERRGQLQLLVSPDGRDGSLDAHQDGLLYATVLDRGEAIDHALAPGRRAYLQVARGTARVNGTTLAEGDGALIERDPHIHIEGQSLTEGLLFDLP